MAASFKSDNLNLYLYHTNAKLELLYPANDKMTIANVGLVQMQLVIADFARPDGTFRYNDK